MTRKTPRSRQPQLRFTPAAWAKLLFLRDLGPTEVGAFGITRPDDLLMVEEIQLVRQRYTATFVAFDDVAVAEYFEHQVEIGRRPEQFGRICIHTHPGDSARPSRVDVETFGRVYGRCDWAVMFILAQGGQTYAELTWRHGGPASISLGVEVDYSQPFAASDHEQWEDEYHTQVDPHACHATRWLDFEDKWSQLSPLGEDLDIHSALQRQPDEWPDSHELQEPAPF